MTCPSLEMVAQWVLDELGGRRDQNTLEGNAAGRFEEHYFGCNLCLARADRLQRLVELLRASLPPLLTAQRRRELEALYPRLPAVHVEPGQRGMIRLGAKAEVGVWVMHAPLARTARVDFEARDAGGSVLFEFRDVPFDRVRGEVVLACQVHYRALGAPAELHARLIATEPGGQQSVSEYVLDHEFESL